MSLEFSKKCDQEGGLLAIAATMTKNTGVFGKKQSTLPNSGHLPGGIDFHRIAGPLNRHGRGLTAGYLWPEQLRHLKWKKMKPLLLLLSLAFAGIALQAQDSPQYRARILDTRIQSAHGRITDGYLYAVSDTALLLSRERRRLNLYDTAAQAGMQSFGYRDLQYVTVHARGGTGIAVVVGLVIGTATGVIIGLGSGDDPPNQILSFTASQKAEILGTFGGVAGALTGLIVGLAAHRTFSINGKKERLNRMSQKLALRMGLTGAP